MPPLTLFRERLERVRDAFAELLGYLARRDDLLKDQVGRTDMRRIDFTDM